MDPGKSMSPTDTIAAVATAVGQAAVAVLRISGPRAVAIGDTLFRGRRPLAATTPRQLAVGTVVDDRGPVDQVLAALFPAPASYTGEDLVEIHCHGGVVVARRILELVVGRGARLAAPGEFTRRAFFNGKMDLTQAEAVMDIVRAQTDLALRAAEEQLAGHLGARVAALRDELLAVLAQIEAHIDFPEEGIAPATGVALRARVGAATAAVAALLATATRGRLLREGALAVICGPPNAGKSSLMNLLLGEERALVHAAPGTTRDSIEEAVDLRGIPLRLADTAGLRPTEHPVELAGIERTRRLIARADLILQVVDASAPPPAPTAPAAGPVDGAGGGEDAGGFDAREATAAAAGSAPRILVLNKSDLGLDPAWQNAAGVHLSCASGEGLASLVTAIEELVWGGRVELADLRVAVNARHRARLQETAAACAAADELLARDAPPELVAVELRAALEAVGEIVGKTDIEALLDQIFGSFCIGK